MIMTDRVDNTAFPEGNPEEIGIAAVHRTGKRLAGNFDYYIKNRPYRPEDLDEVRLHSEAMPLLRGLPVRFREELEGLVVG